ncbi:MAG: 50S ribosomal protein L22 [candidate division WS2 bacterium ADurb.Bin280]|uniref:Large ribosomal subunit protein uL22 n=1 Tax=candidate division WS2 bacterium ADurb.Bin280 TaxID=1852829 RepID=A0A1V5SEP6_9BACT|nr:MAG: 50S ribosomal protein L22 [candidate division WS2 bacterium ADurb.Bin280]
MKIITVSLRNQKVSPKKARLVMTLIRGLKANDALRQLEFYEKKTSAMAKSLLKSALSAAKQKDFDQEDLVISESICQDGPRMRRFYIRARGRSTVFHKRSSHLKISLSTVEKSEPLKTEDKEVTKKEVGDDKTKSPKAEEKTSKPSTKRNISKKNGPKS